MKVGMKMKMKVNITCDDELMKRVDAYAERNFLSRSGLFTLAVTNYLNSVELLGCITDMSVSMRKIADSNEIDEETFNKLQDFERICKAVGVGK